MVVLAVEETGTFTSLESNHVFALVMGKLMKGTYEMVTALFMFEVRRYHL
jgi:hypothetical protein